MRNFLFILALFGVVFLEKPSYAKISCKAAGPRHVACQALERSKTSESDCTAPFDAEADQIERYQPEIICRVLKRIGNDRNCPHMSEALVCSELVAGISLDTQSFVQETKEKYRKQKSEIGHMQNSLHRRKSSLARFEKADDALKDNTYQEKLLRRQRSIELREEDIEEEEESADEVESEAKILMKKNLKEDDIVTLYCKDHAKDRNQADVRIELCEFSYYNVKPSLKSSLGVEVAMKKSPSRTTNKSPFGECNVKEEGAKLTQSLSGLPAASTEVKNLVSYVYRDAVSKYLGIPPLEQGLEKAVESNWTVIEREILRMQETIKGKSDPWISLHVPEFLDQKGVCHNSAFASGLKHYFPKEIRVFTDGNILVSYPKKLGDGKDRSVYVGFDYREVTQRGKETDKKHSLLAVGIVSGDEKETLTEKVKIMKRIYKVQNQLSSEHSEMIKPPKVYVRNKPESEDVSDAITVERLYEGDLDRFMKSGQKVTLEMEISILHQLAILQGAGVVHRDIKPTNILYRYKSGKPLVRVSDYGLMKKIESWNTERFYASGTPQFMPPEGPRGALDPSILDKAYAKKWDSWSAGLTFYAFNYAKKYTHPNVREPYGCDDAEKPHEAGTIWIHLSKVKSYHDVCTVCGTFCDAERNPVTPHGSDDAPTEEYVIWKMINPDPAHRISIDEALALMKKVSPHGEKPHTHPQ